MDNIILRIEFNNQPIFEKSWYRWFWIWSVRDFDDTKHCQESLKPGKKFSLIQDIHTNTDIPITLDSKTTSKNPPKVLLGDQRDKIPHYLCLDFQKKLYNKEDKNYIHFGFIYEEGSHIIKTRKDIGFTLQLSNARELYFDNSVVQKKYNGLDKKYTDCRNFWFGSYYFAKDKA